MSPHRPGAGQVMEDAPGHGLYSVCMPVWGRPQPRELALAGAVGALALTEALTVRVPAGRLLTVVTFLLLAASLAWRVSRPLVPVAAAMLFVPVQTAAGIPNNAALTTLVVIGVAAYSAAAHLRLLLALPAAAGLLAAAETSVLLSHRAAVSNMAFAALIILAPWGAGWATRARLRYASALEQRAGLLQERADLLEEQAAAAAAAAVAAERARIARELHDVISHSLTVIGLQAGGVRRLLLPGQQAERDALLLVEQTGRQAQEEMHHLLALLRPDGNGESLTPQPGLGRLSVLLDDAQAGGLSVETTITGETGMLPAGLDLTVFRIIQEALTNVRKHSDASRVAVAINCTPGLVTVAVTDDGTPGPPGQGGYGLLGMRERTALYGGTLTAGPLPGRGFRIAATLPFRVDPPPVPAPAAPTEPVPGQAP